MKRNLLIVLILVLIGGGFMYLNTNTDFFKGALTTSEESASEDVHIINQLIDPYREKLSIYRQISAQYKNSSNNDTEIAKELDAKILELSRSISRIQVELTNFFNVNRFDSTKVKKIGDEYVICELTELENEACIGFEELGYTKDSLRSLMGLEEFVQPSFQFTPTNFTTMQ